MKKDKNQSVIIVSDGVSPYNSAVNLSKYLSEKTAERGQSCSIKVIFTTDYNEDMAKDNKIIIVGHHTLALTCFKNLKPTYDEYGMKYGYDFDKRFAVLYSSRSELGFDGSGKKAFAGYYNKKIKEHKKTAEKYNIPLKIGQRSSTRQSQYDLLWISFAEQEMGSPLFDFLEIKDAEIEKMTQGEIAEAAFNDMMEKAENFNNLEIEIDNDGVHIENGDKENESNKNTLETDDMQNSEVMDMLRGYRHYNIYMTDMNNHPKEEIIVPEEDLYTGETEAKYIPVGCYLVRYSKRVYIPDEKPPYYHPADKEQVKLAKELLYNNVFTLNRLEKTKGTDLENCIAFTEISAKHITELAKPDPEFHLICRIIDNLNGADVFYPNIAATVKEARKEDDSTASLYIQEIYIGNSHSSEKWHIYSPDTTVRCFYIPGRIYNYTEKWDFDDDTKKVVLQKDKTIYI